VQSSLSSSLLTSSCTSQDSRSLDDIYNFTYDFGDDVDNLEEETSSLHTNGTAYCGSSNSCVVSSTSPTSAAIITTTTTSNSSSTTISSCTVVPMREYNFLCQNYPFIVGDQSLITTSYVDDSSDGLGSCSITQIVQPPAEVRNTPNPKQT